MKNPNPPKYISQDKLIIYQTFPRIWTNSNPNPVRNGKLEENGAGKMNDISAKVLKSIKGLGVNTIWYTGILEMATKTDFSNFGIEPDNRNVVKGEAGSPYAIKDYYDVDPSIAEDVGHRREEFKALVNRTHQAGLRCIIDFVPNHTARRYKSDSAPEGALDFGAEDDITRFFSPENDYYYITNQRFSPSFDISSGPVPYEEFPAKATGNDCFTAFPSAYDWYETVKLNYGMDYGDHSRHFNPIPRLWHKMEKILLHWAGIGVDGFRCDMVFLVPLEFWHWVIPRLKVRYPHIIFIGEIYDVGLYRSFVDYGCFDYLYDKTGLYDTLRGIERQGVSAAQITGCWQAVDGIGGRMLNFLENHDEVRFGSPEFAGNPLNVIPHLVVSSMISTGPFMIYYGQELGESAKDDEGFAGKNNRTTIYDYWSYDTMRRWYSDGKCSYDNLSGQEVWLRDTYSKILNLCNSEPAIRTGGFFDLMYANLRNTDFDPHSIFAFIRHSADEKLLILANFSERDKLVGLNIPEEAFQCCKIEKGTHHFTDLLTNRTGEINLELNKHVRLNIKAKDAIILKLDKFIKHD